MSILVIAGPGSKINSAFIGASEIHFDNEPFIVRSIEMAFLDNKFFLHEAFVEIKLLVHYVPVDNIAQRIVIQCSIEEDGKALCATETAHVRYNEVFFFRLFKTDRRPRRQTHVYIQ